MYLLNEFSRKLGAKDKKKRAKYIKRNLGYETRRNTRNVVRATKDNIIPTASIAATVGSSIYLANKSTKPNNVKSTINIVKNNKGKIGAALAIGTTLGAAYLINKEKNNYNKNPLGYKTKTNTKEANESIRNKLRKVGKISNKLLNY